MWNPKAVIECTPDGPYLVQGLADLRSSSGAAIATQATVALCRCGGSASKPFCDGTHRKIGFSGARLSQSAPERVDYRAPGITIHDVRSVCAHAGHCTDGLASVFKYGEEPWIDPAGAALQAIVETVRRCPSGALSCTPDGEQLAQEAVAPSMTVTKNGPYAVAGAVELVDRVTGQQPVVATRFTLCRCGASKNKPFCDGTHWDIGFTDEKN